MLAYAHSHTDTHAKQTSEIQVKITCQLRIITNGQRQFLHITILSVSSSRQICECQQLIQMRVFVSVLTLANFIKIQINLVTVCSGKAYLDKAHTGWKEGTGAHC